MLLDIESFLTLSVDQRYELLKEECATGLNNLRQAHQIIKRLLQILIDPIEASEQLVQRLSRAL